MRGNEGGGMGWAGWGGNEGDGQCSRLAYMEWGECGSEGEMMIFRLGVALPPPPRTAERALVKKRISHFLFFWEFEHKRKQTKRDGSGRRDGVRARRAGLVGGREAGQAT